jgi:hypothetical protein
MATVSIVPSVGGIYKFTFIDRFNILSGIYKLAKLMTYDEFLEEGEDLLPKLYEPCGLSKEDLDADLQEIKASKIMKLTNPSIHTENSLMYMPLCFMDTTPDHNVKCYYKFGVVAYVGITEDPSTLSEIKNTIKDRAKAMLGIDPDPALITVGEEWLTESDYQEIVSRRKATQSGVLNYFSENVRLEKELTSLKSTLAAYEEIIRKQNAQIQSLSEDNGS